MEKKLSEQERYLLVSNKDVNDIFKIIKSLEDLLVLIDGVTETVKLVIKKPGGKFRESLLDLIGSSLMQLVIFSVVKVISGRAVRKAGRGYKD